MCNLKRNSSSLIRQLQAIITCKGTMKKKICTLLSSLLLVATRDVAASHSMQNESFYLPLEKLFASQLRYSSQNVKEKTIAFEKNGDISWNENQKCWNLKHADGKSALSLERAIPIIIAPFGFAIADGHHHVLASLEVGAQLIPVKVIKRYSDVSQEQFWEQAEVDGLAYPYDLAGARKIPPRTFQELQDDPNRYFASIVARKCKADGDLSKSKGATYPLWIKVGKDIPFIEFKIADALYQAGIFYTYDMGKKPPKEFIEQAREALVGANIPGLRVVNTHTHYSQLKSQLYYGVINVKN